jgi:hypothetical protein
MVVGTSEPQDFALFNDGSALVGTGLDVEIVWHSEPRLGACGADWPARHRFLVEGPVVAVGADPWVPSLYIVSIGTAGGTVGFRVGALTAPGGPFAVAVGHVMAIWVCRTPIG